MRDLFTSRDFVRVWTGTLVSTLAMEMQYVARGWFVYSIDDSALDLAWVAMAFTLPQVVFSLPGGVLADRYTKRTIIVVAHALNAGATFVLGLLILGNDAELFHFIAFGILNGTFLALSFPSRQAIVPHVVNEKLVFSALALSATALNVSRVAGPALAGLLIYWISRGEPNIHFAVGVVYLVISSLYLLASLVSLTITTPGRAKHSLSSIRPFRDMFEVVKFVTHKPVVLRLVLLSVFAYMFGHTLSTFLPAFNESILQGSARSYGFLLASLGIASIVGSLTVAWAKDFRHKRSWLVGIQLFWGISILLVGFSRWMWLAFVLVGLIGWLAGAGMALNRSLVQRHVGTDLLGRVMSIDMIAHGMMPLSAVPLGMLADAMGIDFAISVSGGLLVGTITLALLARSALKHPNNQFIL